MTQNRLWHNPRCSKSRQTFKILESNNVNLTIVKYLEEPLEFNQLKEILDLLKLQPRELMRKHEKPYKEQNLANPDLTEEDLINAMINHPILIERPIFICNNQAVIGRPPENVLKLI